MDAGHLSQTLYLVCGELGLGAFVAGAINDATIDERLGLRAFEEGALAICGCGRPEPSGLEPVFEPFVPGGYAENSESGSVPRG
jgi:nitroreductase